MNGLQLTLIKKFKKGILSVSFHDKMSLNFAIAKK